MAKAMQTFHSLLISNLTITTEEVVEWVVDNYYVDNVYSTDVLNQWALDNGYIKPTETDLTSPEGIGD